MTPGNIIGKTGTARDTDENNTAESALTDSEKKFREIFNSIADAIHLVEIDDHGLPGRLIDVNEMACHLVQYNREELLGKYPIAFTTGMYNMPFAQIEEELTTKGSVLFETEFKRKDGSLVPVEVNARLVTIGNTPMMLSVIHDLSRRRNTETALRQSEERFSLIFRIAPLVMMISDVTTGRYYEVNDKFSEVSGFSREEVIGRTSVELGIMTASVRENLRDMILAQGLVKNLEIAVQGKGNRNIICRLNGEIITIDQKPYLLSILEDITLQKSQEAAIQKLHEENRMILDNTPIMIWYKDTRNNIIRINPAGARALGMAVDALEGRSCNDLFPDLAEEYYRDDLEVIRSGKPKLGIIESLTTAGGKQLWVRVDKLPLFDESGTVNGVLLFMTDLTEQRQAEQSIAESSAFLATMIDTLPIPIFYKDKEGKYLGCNPLFERYIGISRNDIIGKTVYEIFPRDLADVYRAADQEVFDNPLPQKYETRIRFADDSRHEIIFYKAPFFRHDGSVGGLIGAFHDITDQKLAHDALQTANRKLNLLSSITRHDIRNQLMALNAYIHLCGNAAGVPAEVMNFIAKEEKIAEAIARQIDFTKDYEDIGVRSAVWQNIAPLIRKSETSLPLGPIQLKIDCDGYEIFADPLLEKVFYNLIDNSLHYGGEKMTSIHVTEERSGKDLRIIYEDDGEGIRDDDRDQLFTKGFGKNTGLGLFLSHEILSITGITITETGKQGEGARFEIAVPEGTWRIAAGE